MSPARLLERNVRPVRHGTDNETDGEDQSEDDVSVAENINEDEESVSGSDVGSVSDVDAEDNGEDDHSDDDELEPAGDEDIQQQISHISFGALKQAQDAASRKRKRGSESSPEHDDKLEKLRERLRHIKEAKLKDAVHSDAKSSVAPNKSSTRLRTAQPGDVDEDQDSDDDDDSDSAPSEEESQPKSRASKHAPAAQSSRHQVTRKRTVIDVPKRVIRDPRFDAIQQRSAHTGDSEKAYDFIQDYQKSEVDELKAAIKRTKDEDDKTTLRRKVVSMENKFKAKAAKDREQEVLRAHRKEEREAVQAGKQPYYLKRKELKERALVEKFKGMKAKEREKVVEKRRKKEGQKEKKMMPNARRVVG